MKFPRLYAIVDGDLLATRSLPLDVFTAELQAAGIGLVQYRNKQAGERRMLSDATLLRNTFSGTDTRLIFNDRADLAVIAGFHGVHVGQEDLDPEEARSIVGPQAWVGVSTHTPEQVRHADRSGCNYIAYGPIYSTTNKQNPDPIVGLEGLHLARACTSKPLVAIGGITRSNCRTVMEAGADSVAVISDLLPQAAGKARSTNTTGEIAREFLALLTQ